MWVLRAIAEWFTGGRESYQPLIETMQWDIAWAMVLVVLAVGLLIGYTLLWREWRRHESELLGSVRRQALGRLRQSLLLSAAGGYAFLPVAMFWPGWRLYALVLVAMTLLVWRLAWTRRDVGLVCRTLDRSRTGRGALASARAEAREKSFFLNALGHDLKNPLHGLTLQLQLAEMKIDQGDPEAVRRALHLMRQCTDEANQLLESFLELGRLDWCDDEPMLSTFDTAALIDAAVAEHEPLAAAKGLALEREMPAPLWVQCDRSKLDRIIRNLLSNAIKYTNEGKVLIQGWEDGRSVVLVVEDTGSGVPLEQQERLFDVFFRAHAMDADGPSGHGLGLAIADRLVQQLGGHIDLESEPGRGSRFRVTLPDAHVSAEPRNPLHVGAELGGASPS